MRSPTRREILSGFGATATFALAGASSQTIAQSGMTGPGWSELYFDNHGLIVQRDHNGGDTAQREGWVWLGIWVRENVLKISRGINLPIDLETTLNLLEVGTSGEFRRHPTQPKWSDPKEFSRDQMVPLIAAMGVWGQTARVQRSWNARRSCRYPQLLNFPLPDVFNTKCVQGTPDPVFSDMVNLYRRAMRQQPDALGEGWLAGGVELRLDQAASNPDNVGDDLNLIVYLLIASLISPTDVTRHALARYATKRPVSFGSYLGRYRMEYLGDFSADRGTMQARIIAGKNSGWAPDCPNVLGAIRWYFRVEENGCPALAELYAPIIDHFFS